MNFNYSVYVHLNRETLLFCYYFETWNLLSAFTKQISIYVEKRNGYPFERQKLIFANRSTATLAQLTTN